MATLWVNTKFYSRFKLLQCNSGSTHHSIYHMTEHSLSIKGLTQGGVPVGLQLIAGDPKREEFMDEGELAGQAFEVQVTAKVISLKNHHVYI